MTGAQLVARSQGIGLSQCGMGEALHGLNGAPCRESDDLAWKNRNGAHIILAAHEWHLNTSYVVKASMNAIVQQVEEGSGVSIALEPAAADRQPHNGFLDSYGLVSGSVAEAMCFGVDTPSIQADGTSSPAPSLDGLSSSEEVLSGLIGPSGANDLVNQITRGGATMMLVRSPEGANSLAEVAPAWCPRCGKHRAQGAAAPRARTDQMSADPSAQPESERCPTKNGTRGGTGR